MREMMKSMWRFSWAALTFGVRQLSHALGSVTPSPEQLPKFGDSLLARHAIKKREVIPTSDPAHGASAENQSHPPVSDSPQSVKSNPPDTVSFSREGILKTSPFIVVGESLAAGMWDFSLSEDTQQFSFPAQTARQMGCSLIQPLMQPPGIGGAIGFTPWTVMVPSPLQSTVLDRIPAEPLSNLSVPNLKVSDAIRMRPQQPLIDRTNSQQTVLNLILGLRGIMNGEAGPLPTQLEMAVESKPALAVVELGYAEAVEAAVTGEPDHLQSINSFRNDYSKIVKDLRATGANVVVLTIPNPTDTAHFSTIQSAASLLKLDVPLMRELWEFAPDDLITANGLNEMAFQLNAVSIGPSRGKQFSPLPRGSSLASATADQLRLHIQGMNEAIRQIAKENSAVVCDLYSLMKKLHNTGITVGSRTLTSEYLGGLYSLNGYYPGATGQALIANELLACLNQEFGASFPLIDVAEVLASDPVAGYKKAEGANWTRNDLTSPQPLSVPGAAISPSAVNSVPPDGNAADAHSIDVDPSYALRLPAGLQQILPLNEAASYFGDAISAQNCRTAKTIQWSSGNNLLFGGLAMMDSHISGNVLIKFTPPVGEWTTFKISFAQGLVGTDSVLTAPIFYKLPGKQQVIGDVPGHISTGKLNLRTGQVDPTAGSLSIYASFFNSALFALIRVNPNFPTTPLSFPGQYGSASVAFEQRPDGKLDFTFQGSTFVPLGDGTAFPLNFCGPSREYASIPSNGTALHPHIALTTKQSSPAQSTTGNPTIPFNTLQEFTLFTAASSFGDLFTLNAPETGGPALGRSHLLGRVQIQFGPRSGDTVPIAVSTSTTGGMLEPLARTPITQLFPGQLTPGPVGFSESLRFPLRSYSLNDLAIFDDPFDVSVGALNLRTGTLLHPLLHRAFINQVVLFALLRVEPRTPTSSFFFKGPGGLQQGSSGELVFQLFAETHLPYPAGYWFPDPNLSTAFSVVDGGALDPYLWLWAIKHGDTPVPPKTVDAQQIVSSRGEVFSYRFSIPASKAEASAHFEYENHTQQGSFRMHSVTWLDYGKATIENDIFDTFTFSGFGVWTKNGIERVVQAAVQFSNSSNITYVGVQVGKAGEISNANALTPASAFPVPLKAASTLGLGAASVSQLAGATGSVVPALNVDTKLKKEASPMFSHIIELIAKPGQAKSLVSIIHDRAIPEVIKGSKGFIDQIVLISASDPNHVSAISFWRSKEDGDLFFQNGFHQVSALTESFLIAKPESHEFSVAASTNDHIRS